MPSREAVGCNSGHSITPRTNRAHGGSRSRSRSQMNMRRMNTVRSPNSRTDATEPGGTNRKPLSGTVSLSWPTLTFASCSGNTHKGLAPWKARPMYSSTARSGSSASHGGAIRLTGYSSLLTWIGIGRKSA